MVLALPQNNKNIRKKEIIIDKKRKNLKSIYFTGKIELQRKSKLTKI